MDIEEIRQALAAGKIDLTNHAIEELDNDGVWREDIVAAARSFDVIDTACDEAGVKSTIEGRVIGDVSVRLVVAWSEEEQLLKVITAYVRRRKRRGGKK